MYEGHSELGSLGDTPVGEIVGVQVVSTAANFIPVVGPLISGIIKLFAAIFGGGKPPDPPRDKRSAGIYQNLANCTALFPPELEDKALSLAKYNFEVEGSQLCVLTLMLPQNCAQGLLASAQAMLKTVTHTNAINAIKGSIALIQSLIPRCLTGQQWWDVYRAVGFTPIINVAQGCTVGLHTGTMAEEMVNWAMDQGIGQLPDWVNQIPNLNGTWNQGTLTYANTPGKLSYTVTPQGGNPITGHFLSPTTVRQSDIPNNLGTVSNNGNLITFSDGGVHGKDIPNVVAIPNLNVPFTENVPIAVSTPPISTTTQVPTSITAQVSNLLPSMVTGTITSPPVYTTTQSPVVAALSSVPTWALVLGAILLYNAARKGQ